MLNFPDAWTREERVAWNRLRRRMPGLEADMERCVMKMAVMTGHSGQARIRYEETAEGYVAFIEVVSLLHDGGHKHVSYPVLPDEFNPRSDKQILPDMAPHVFARFDECRKSAEEAESILLKQLRAAERSVANGTG